MLPTTKFIFQKFVFLKFVFLKFVFDSTSLKRSNFDHSCLDTSIKQAITTPKNQFCVKNRGIFTVLLAAAIFALIGLMTLGVDTFILMQSKMDLNIAAEQAAVGALRYLTDSKLWPDPNIQSTVSGAEEKMKKLVEANYVIGANGNMALDTDFSFDPLAIGYYNVSTRVFTLGTDPCITETGDDCAAARKNSASFVSNPLDPLFPEEWSFFAVKVKLSTNSTGAKLAGVFTSIYNPDGYAVSTTAIAYYDTSALGVSPYAIAQ